MAALPQIKSAHEGEAHVVHSTPPTSSVSTAQIKAPYVEFSNAMDSVASGLTKFGEGLGSAGKAFDKANKQAQKDHEQDEEQDAADEKGGRRRGGRRGRRGRGGPGDTTAVSVGNETSDPVVKMPGAEPVNELGDEQPIPGKPDKSGMADDVAYERLANMKAMITSEQQASAGIAQIHSQFPQEPHAFLTASAEYKDETLKQFHEAGAPAVAAGLDHSIDHAVEENLSAMLRNKHASDVSATQAAVSGKLDDLSSTMQSEALAGRTTGDAFRRAQADYMAIATEAKDNHLYGMNENRLTAHLDNAIAQAHVAAITGAARRVFAQEGEYGAQEFVDNNLHHLGLDDEAHGDLKAQLYADIGSQVAKQRADRRNMLKVESDGREARTNEGYHRIADGSLNQDWLDRNSTQIDPQTRSVLQRAMYAPDPEVTAPEARNELTQLAIVSPKRLAAVAAEALSDGQLSRHDFDAMLDLSTKVIDDQKKRPWLNDMRRSLSKWPDAIDELSAHMGANPTEDRSDLREYASTIRQQYSDRDYRKAAARRPPLPFTFEPKGEYTLETVSLSGQEIRKQFEAGKLPPDQFVDEIDKLKMWHSFIQEKMQKDLEESQQELSRERYNDYRRTMPSGQGQDERMPRSSGER